VLLLHIHVLLFPSLQIFRYLYTVAFYVSIHVAYFLSVCMDPPPSRDKQSTIQLLQNVMEKGGEVGGIILWPLGGFALCGPADGGASADFKVAIAGPLTHIPQMIVWVILYIAFTGGNISGLFSTSSVALYEVSYGGFTGFLSQLCKQTFWMNLHILGFNLFIPAFPLDGGRCLAASLVMCKVRVEKAAMITSVVAFVIAIGMGIWGFIPLIIGDDPNGLFMVFIAGFVLVSSKQLFDLTRAGRVREHPLFSRSCYDEREESSDDVEATEGTLT